MSCFILENSSSSAQTKSSILAITMADIRRHLAAEEAAAVLAGETQLHEISASQFLLTGIELEDQQ